MTERIGSLSGGWVELSVQQRGQEVLVAGGGVPVGVFHVVVGQEWHSLFVQAAVGSEFGQPLFGFLPWGELPEDGGA